MFDIIQGQVIVHVRAGGGRYRQMQICGFLSELRALQQGSVRSTALSPKTESGWGVVEADANLRIFARAESSRTRICRFEGFFVENGERVGGYRQMQV